MPRRKKPPNNSEPRRNRKLPRSKSKKTKLQQLMPRPTQPTNPKLLRKPMRLRLTKQQTRVMRKMAIWMRQPKASQQ